MIGKSKTRKLRGTAGTIRWRVTWMPLLDAARSATASDTRERRGIQLRPCKAIRRTEADQCWSKTVPLCRTQLGVAFPSEETAGFLPPFLPHQTPCTVDRSKPRRDRARQKRLGAFCPILMDRTHKGLYKRRKGTSVMPAMPPTGVEPAELGDRAVDIHVRWLKCLLKDHGVAWEPTLGDYRAGRELLREARWRNAITATLEFVHRHGASHDLRVQDILAEYNSLKEAGAYWYEQLASRYEGLNGLKTMWGSAYQDRRLAEFAVKGSRGRYPFDPKRFEDVKPWASFEILLESGRPLPSEPPGQPLGGEETSDRSELVSGLDDLDRRILASLRDTPGRVRLEALSVTLEPNYPPDRKTMARHSQVMASRKPPLVDYIPKKGIEITEAGREAIGEWSPKSEDG